MSHEPENAGDASIATAAGDFSAWLRATEASLQSGVGGADVPCGSCRGCCRSSMFIHIKPDEKQTIRQIPRALLFPAPGRPKGHVLMGYGDQGNCPMLAGGECSIYEDRPRTCRDYDCRVFAATGISVDEQAQPEIAHRVNEWVFSYENEAGREEHRILKEAAAFLEDHRELFPPGSLPNYPVQMAAFAVSVFRLYADLAGRRDKAQSALSDADIAHRILNELTEPNAG
jgi:Fe-S-cluster containining protein